MDEIKYDLKEYLKVITKATNKKVHVMGLSQGSSGIFTALADTDEISATKIANMIEKVYAFAPVIYTVREIHRPDLI